MVIRLGMIILSYRKNKEMVETLHDADNKKLQLNPVKNFWLWNEPLVWTQVKHNKGIPPTDLKPKQLQQ